MGCVWLLDMIEIIILIVTQLAFSVARNLNFQYVYNKDMIMTIISSTVIKATALISTWIGIDSLINGDILMVVVYLVSGSLGDYISLKIKLNKI